LLTFLAIDVGEDLAAARFCVAGRTRTGRRAPKSDAEFATWKEMANNLQQ